MTRTRKRTLDTQVGYEAYDDGELKVVSYDGGGQGWRPLRVRLVFDECVTCGALLLDDAVSTHADWHAKGIRQVISDVPVSGQS